MAIKSNNAAISDGAGHAQSEPIFQSIIGKEGGTNRSGDQQEQRIGGIGFGCDDDGTEIGKEGITSDQIHRIGDDIQPDNRPIIGWPEAI